MLFNLNWYCYVGEKFVVESKLINPVCSADMYLIMWTHYFSECMFALVGFHKEQQYFNWGSTSALENEHLLTATNGEPSAYPTCFSSSLWGGYFNLLIELAFIWLNYAKVPCSRFSGNASSFFSFVLEIGRFTSAGIPNESKLAVVGRNVVLCSQSSVVFTFLKISGSSAN